MSEIAEKGREIIREMMGDEFIAKRDAKKNWFNAAIQDYSDEVCFGRTWSREGIDRKQRSILNIAMLIALNRIPQLRTHINGALSHGCTPQELQEILLHTAVYCGIPASVEGFKVGEEVLRERGLLD